MSSSTWMLFGVVSRPVNRGVRCWLNMMENRAEFLTTIEIWDLSKLLARTGPGTNVLVTIEVQPRHSRTGLLEEKGRWIHRVWNAILSGMPNVAGHRLSWSQLVFIYAGSDIQTVESQFVEILQSCWDEELKSLCVLSKVSGNAEAKLFELDRMLEAISKERNFGNPKRFQHWLLDGERLLLREAPVRNI